MMKRHVPLLFAANALIGAGSMFGLVCAAEPPVDFNRDVRAVLSDSCFKCHGPDAAQRKGELRLDTKEGLLGKAKGGPVIVPGKPSESELIRRVTATDPEMRMPPADSGKKLSAGQIEKLRRWVAEGARWQQHWSFVPPQRPALPKLAEARLLQEAGLLTWPRNAIDRFVLDRLLREGLRPSPEADRTTLIRRVSLDLTGLPPTPEEVAAFLADRSPDAYERLVDRLLASPRYGERMAVPWLNAARYADTSGYQNDGPRHMWRWRDWVIDAFNANQPFDQLTLEQLAGDLLPRPTLAQRIATGFNRNHRGNAEGGIIPAEYQVEYVVDRVETTFTVWLGLTMGCARCHSHKFDPLTQREFYQAFAYFNNIPEYGRAIKEGNSPPYVKAPTEEQQRQLDTLRGEAAAAAREFKQLAPRLAAEQQRWEQGAHSATRVDWSPTRGLVAHFPLDGAVGSAVPTKTGNQPASGSTSTKSVDKLVGTARSSQKKVGPPHPTFIGNAAFAAGRLGQAADFDGRRFIAAGDVGKFGYFDKFSLSAWIYPRGDGGSATGGTIVSRMTDDTEADGYYLRLVDGRLQANLVKRWLDDAIRVETERMLTPDRWHHVAMTYDGSRLASGVTIYVDGEPQRLRVNLDLLNQTFALNEPLRIGGGFGPGGRFVGRIDEVRLYERSLAADEVQSLATADSISDILAIPAEKRSRHQTGKLRPFFLARKATAELRQAHQRMIATAEAAQQFDESLPTVMVMQEMPTPRATHVLTRGQYDKPAERVEPGMPASLPPLPEGAPRNRLALARWLIDPANPLTARVAVNRFWELHFGVGLVKTSEDFGSQGERPSHPELLDWLACEFTESRRHAPRAATAAGKTSRGETSRKETSTSGSKADGRRSVPAALEASGGAWDVKALQRLIVTSAAYRQSSRAPRELVARDPENRLLARGPRFRLSAETIRDQALAASGLLVEHLGGPSVKVYQPEGLWGEIATDTEYAQDHGAALYRRGLYTYWKRTVAPPMMATFDASARETCTVRPTRTNTPLQALALMNETAFVEAARMMAERVLAQGGSSDEERVRYAFRLALTRPPRPEEERTLLAGLRFHRERYRRDAIAAKQLLEVGEHPVGLKQNAGELAAYTALAGLILNLDEVVTKE